MNIYPLLFVILAGSAVAPAAVAQNGSNQPDLNECRTIVDPNARLRCYEHLSPPPELASVPAFKSLPTAQAFGSWKLVHTPDPRGGKEAIAINRTGELSGSDPDFVGLTLRCANPDVDIAIVLIQPLPFRSRPQVTLNGSTFEATIGPPGSVVLLPPDASMWAKQNWPTATKLSVVIQEANTKIRGLVMLDGFDAALSGLAAECRLRQ